MKSSSRARSYRQCFICRVWSWDVSKQEGHSIGADLCLPCYVDVLEVRQNRGELGRRVDQTAEREAPVPRERPGPRTNPPGPFRQLDLFD